MQHIRPLTRLLPFSARHGARLALDDLTARAGRLADTHAESSNPLGRAYRRAYLRRRFRSLAPLLAPGELVFDVGANVGLWTDGLRGLGCRVVAVEPQAACADRLRTRRRNDPLVTVVEAAVASREGEIELFLAPSSEQATTSSAWMDAMISRGGVPASYWQRSIRVPARTLDDLIDEFGEPAYAKLDVEGAEGDALAGLSKPLRIVSFETHGQTYAEARSCVDRLLELGDYEFVLGAGDFPRFDGRGWGSREALLAALQALPFGWNNAFARLRGHTAPRRPAIAPSIRAK